ncbi:MAG: response regulator [Chitinophagales bacterium]|nr:response regulator [Chitinophagales bacterium]
MKKFILICEDDEGIADLCKYILEPENYDVVTLNNCNLVLEKIRERKPDVILLDLWMPGMDGESILQILKTTEHTKDIPVIIMSANNDIRTISERAGANDYLMKPFDIHTLKQKVKQFIGE